MTTANELLAPYATVLREIQDRSDGRVTLAEALIRLEAAHVADVRNALRTPKNGWRNTTPLEHETLLGRFICGLRIGDHKFTRNALGSPETRDIASTLLNAENVYVDGYDWRRMTTDQIIDRAAVDLEMYGE